MPYSTPARAAVCTQETGAPIKQGRATSAPPSDGKGKTKSAFKGLVKKGTRWVKEVCHFGKKPKGAQPAATGVVITAPAAVKPELGAASAAESSATKPTPAAAPAAEAVVPKPTERSAQIVAIPPSPAPEPQPHFTVKDVAGLLKGAQKFRDVAVTAIARPLAQGLNHIVDIFGEVSDVTHTHTHTQTHTHADLLTQAACVNTASRGTAMYAK